MSKSNMEPHLTLEGFFGALRDEQLEELERLSPAVGHDLSFTRVVRIARGEVQPTPGEAQHLADCAECQRITTRARASTPALASNAVAGTPSLPVPQTTKPLFDRVVDGFGRVRDWVDRATDFRRSVPCTFTFAGASGYVLGDPTQTFTCNLMYLLEELGVADSFETFKLVCETGNGTTVSAVLIPRPPVSEQSGIEVMLYLSAPQQPQERSTKRGGTPRPLIFHLKPFEHVTSTPKLEFSMMRDPATFAGSLEIRIQEAVAAPEEE